MLYNALSTFAKFVIAAVAIGAALNAFDISSQEVLREIGVTPDAIIRFVQDGIDWALPNFLLGAMVLVPIWVVIFLLKPPKIGR